jgi:hypothetical protein
MRTPDQEGFFGPGSVTWRVMARPEIWVGASGPPTCRPCIPG